MKKMIIIASTALILTGGLVTYAYSNEDGSKHKNYDREKHFQEIISQLPAEKAELVEATMEKMHEERKESFTQIRALEKEIKVILTAEKFDEKAFSAKSAELHKLHGASQEKMNHTIIDLASQMSSDERKILAKVFKPKFKHKNHGDKEGYKNKSKDNADDNS